MLEYFDDGDATDDRLEPSAGVPGLLRLPVGAIDGVYSAGPSLGVDVFNIFCYNGGIAVFTILSYSCTYTSNCLSHKATDKRNPS